MVTALRCDEAVCTDCGNVFERVPTPGRPRRRCMVCLPYVAPKPNVGKCVKCRCAFEYPARGRRATMCLPCRIEARREDAQRRSKQRYADGKQRIFTYCQVCAVALPRKGTLCLEHRRKEVHPEALCRCCGTAFQPTTRGNQNPKLFCSRECQKRVGQLQWEHRTGNGPWQGPVIPTGDATEIMCSLNWRSCIDCGTEWLVKPGSYPQRCVPCGDAHRRQEALAFYYRVTKPREGFGQRRRVCGFCGDEFVGHGRRSYCDRCPDARAVVYRQAPERITVQELARRDRDRCWLCGLRVSISERTVDHVWPIAKGGTHIWSNVRLAHRRCNSSKGDRLVTAQLGLV